MKISWIIIAFFAFAGCSSPEDAKNQDELFKFNAALGENPSITFDKLIESQNAFLELNYADIVNPKNRAVAFLSDEESLFDPSRLTFATKENLSLLNDLELSGLRTELFELHETLVFTDDSTGERYITQLINNLSGKYIMALNEVSSDPLVSGYLEAVVAAGDLNPPIVASGLMENGFDYDNPIHQRIMATEIYFKLIRWDTELKRHTNKK